MTINPKRIGLMAFDADIAAARTGQRPKVRVGHIAFPHCNALAATDNGRVTFYGHWAAKVTYRQPRTQYVTA